MNSPKVKDEDYINFIIATPRTVTATEAQSCQPESRNAPSHDAFTRLLQRLEPDPEVLWTEAKTQLERQNLFLRIFSVLPHNLRDRTNTNHRQVKTPILFSLVLAIVCISQCRITEGIMLPNSM